MPWRNRRLRNGSRRNPGHRHGGLTPQYTYNSQNDNGMTFEKVSHADQGLSQADGVVDYTATAPSPPIPPA